MTPLGIRRKDLAAVIGSETIAQEFIDHKWLKPIVHDGNICLFAFSDIAKAFARLAAEGRPKKK